MTKSRYENHVIRKPAIVAGLKHVVVDKIDCAGKADTGPLVWCSLDLIADSKILLESGIISRDVAVGTGGAGTFTPHKHVDFDEVFTLLGTNPNDPTDLGAEAEFWLGEGEELEKIFIDHSTSVYVPAGLAHFPLVWRNVKRPCIFIAVACAPYKRDRIREIPVSLKGRPT